MKKGERASTVNANKIAQAKTVMEIAASLGNVERWKVSNKKRYGLRKVSMWLRETSR